MEVVVKIFEAIRTNWATIATILFLTSEIMGESQAVKNNSIFGAVVSLVAPTALKKMAEESKQTPAAQQVAPEAQTKQ